MSTPSAKDRSATSDVPRQRQHQAPRPQQAAPEVDQLDALREREREDARRRLRHGIVLTVLALIVVGATVTALGQFRNWWSVPFLEQPIQGAVSGCENVGVLPEIGDVKVEVLNAHGEAGAAGALASALRDRGFDVQGASNAAAEPVSAAPVTVTHSADTEDAARIVAAHFESAAIQLSREDTSIIELRLEQPTAALIDPSVAGARVDEMREQGQALQNLCLQGR